MSRRLERVGIWLGATVGGGGLVYAAMTAATNTAPALLGVLWVLGVALLAVGILGFASETVAWVNRVLPDRQTPVPPRPRQSVPPANAAPPLIRMPPPSKNTARQVVQVTPTYLIGLFNGRTSMEGNRLLADFIGKWIAVSGRVNDVSEFSSDHLFVQVHDDTPDEVYVSLSFRGEWADRASTMRRGDLIHVIGEIKEADRAGLALDPCELPSDNQSNSAAIS